MPSRQPKGEKGLPKGKGELWNSSRSVRRGEKMNRPHRPHQKERGGIWRGATKGGFQVWEHRNFFFLLLVFFSEGGDY